jgi:hypothetical protein
MLFVMSYLQTLWDIFERFLYSEYEENPNYDVSEYEQDSESEIIDIQTMSSGDTICTSVSTMGIQKRLSSICDNV